MRAERIAPQEVPGSGRGSAAGSLPAEDRPAAAARPAADPPRPVIEIAPRLAAPAEPPQRGLAPPEAPLPDAGTGLIDLRAPAPVPAYPGTALATEGATAAAIVQDRPAFLAFVADEQTEAAVRGGLAELVPAIQIRRGTARTAVRSLEREATPRTLLVDVTGLDDAFAALEELASVCTPDVRVVVVGENAEISFYRRLIRDLGVTEYIHKPLTRDTALRLIGPLLIGADAAEAASRSGRIVAVAGVRGGVGATTVAVGLALEIAASTRGHVALLDLHLRGGATGLMLGVQPTTGFRVALEEPERADGLFLDRVAIPIAERLRLVAAEEKLESDPRPTEEGIRRVLALLRQRFNHIVVDMPMPPGTAERAVLAAARYCVLVLGPDIVGIRNAVAARQMVTALGGGVRTMTVLNRARAPGAIATRLVAEGLGGPPDLLIPDLPREVPRAINLGRPAVRDSATLRRALAPLTQEVTALPAAAAPARPLFGWLFGRGGR
jgi:pilus assembly protein CpaE